MTTRLQFHRSSSMPITVGRNASSNLVDDAEKRINEEIKQLVRDIRRIGSTYPSPAPHVLFGELFDDDFVQQYYEALMGTLKAAKKRGIIKFRGQMLLKGMHDNVVVSIVDECPPPPIDIPRTKTTEKPTSADAKSEGIEATAPPSEGNVPVPTEQRTASTTSGMPASETMASIAEGENIDEGGKEYQQKPESNTPAEAPARPSGGNEGETEKQQDLGNSIKELALGAGSSTPSTATSSTSSKFSFTTPEREQYQQRVEQKKQIGTSSNPAQSGGNWRPAPWRQRPHSTTSTSSPLTKPKKKDGKRRLSAPIPSIKGGKGAQSKQTVNNRPDMGVGNGEINTDVYSVPEDVALKAPPNASSVASGTGGLSKAAAAALGGPASNTNKSTSKTAVARRFLKPRKSGGVVSSKNAYIGRNDDDGDEDNTSVGGSSITSFGGVSIASAPAQVLRSGGAQDNPSSYRRPTYRSNSNSAAAVEAHKARLDEEIDQLLVDIRRVGTNPGEPCVAFGELFDDDAVQNYYEALVGTLKSAKRRGVVNFKGQMLLKGMHDSVLIEIVNP